MNIKKNKFALIGTILNGVEMGIYCLITLIIIAFKDNADFRYGFSEGAGFGSSYFETTTLLDAFLIVFLLFSLYTIIKFVTALFGYNRQSRTLILVSAILGVLSTLLFTVSLSPIAILDIVSCVLMFIAYAQMGSNKVIDNKVDNSSNNGVEL